MSELADEHSFVLATARAMIADKFSANMIEKDNISTINGMMIAGKEPLTYAISIPKARLTSELIRKSGVFAINFMHKSHHEGISTCHSMNGEHSCKFRRSGLAKYEAEKIDCPTIGQALSVAECEVTGEIDCGNDIIFLGKLLRMTQK